MGENDMGENDIKSFPRGIGRLTCLKTLSYFPVGKGEEICQLGELDHLNHIQGTLIIYGLKNVVDFGSIENTLKKKNHLRCLILSFNTLEEIHSESEKEEEEEEEEEEVEEETEEERRRKMEKDAAILNALEPPPCLKILAIGYYKGTTMYPNWMMSKLTYLKWLIIGKCPNLEQLPPLGKLPLLEELVIWEAPMIRKVGDEFLGIDELSESSKNSNNKDIIIFPNLKSLQFDFLKKWEEWTGMGGTIEEEEEKDNSANAFVTNNTPKIKIMPLLRSLKILRCGNLKSLPDYLRNTPLKELEINECPILEQRCERGIGDYWPYISYIPNIKIDDKYVQRDGQLPDNIDSELKPILFTLSINFYTKFIDATMLSDEAPLRIVNAACHGCQDEMKSTSDTHELETRQLVLCISVKSSVVCNWNGSVSVIHFEGYDCTDSLNIGLSMYLVVVLMDLSSIFAFGYITLDF
ncbi:hypothetical protein SO802_008012 [Lithocarpus litseifolius]|uniref:R13L1/DRL21-like LRR repeat region domain-containing protein n=1 Tax=Lithocarpus litseifolius TaxID=425828 RepID=A0AAW2DRZ6_9ROSI